MQDDADEAGRKAYEADLLTSKRPYEPPEITSRPLDTADDLLHSVTRSCEDSSPFMRGFAEGLKPLLLDKVREAYLYNADMRVICLGPAQVTVTGLEQIQATSLYQLGRDKGETLRELATAAFGEAIARHEREHPP